MHFIRHVSPVRAGLPWLMMLLWAALQMLIAWQSHRQQRGPIDFLSYQIAADKVAHGVSPYQTETEDLAIWRGYHRLEEQWRDPLSPEPAVQPGPYLYPPTLALIVAQSGIGPVAFVAVIALSVMAFAAIWLQATEMRAASLLLVALSWDIVASASGGNVELVILGSTMAAARLLCSSRPALAAPLIAFVLLVKPFYFLFFAAFAIIWLVTTQPAATRRLDAIATTAVITLVLIGVEVYRWGPALVGEAMDFMRHGLEHHWFVLPVDLQTPMSTWNRTPMQALVNAGVSPTAAFQTALLSWAVLLTLTVWRVAGQAVAFPQTFALAFVLLCYGRPVGWTLNYLEFVVLGVLWPSASHRMRLLLIAAAVAVMASHWLALIRTARHMSLQLFTLQSAEFPWESWFMVPLCWLLLLGVHHRHRSQAAT